MRKKTKVLSVTALVAGATVFGMIVAGSLGLTKGASADRSAAPTPVPVISARPQPAVVMPSFADIAEQVIPAVVSVTSTDIVKADKRRAHPRFFGDGEGNPFDYFFGPDGKRRPDEEEEDQKEMSGGTGFLIEPNGFILTNNHVIEGADKIEVKVGDKDDYEARVVGRDPATDLALLKIEGTQPFPTVRLGDSDRLRVGEWVMAIGDPLQFEKTVTVGVVSGKGRWAGLSRATTSFESLIQTDAAINFGNSGGPLVNVSGEVIGINAAMARIAQNIGFAVPINMAKRLIPQLKAGKVVRGFLGVNIVPVDRKFQEAFGLSSAEGALVQSVERGTPGQKAGLKRGDVILRVDDTHVKTSRDLIDYISGKAPGSKVNLALIRDGKEKSVPVVLGTRAPDGGPVEVGEVEKESKEDIGISIVDLTPSARRSYEVDKSAAAGVVITHVKPVSASADAGLLAGDVILEVNENEVASVDDYRAKMKKISGKVKYVRFYVLRSHPRPTMSIVPVRLQE